jgi:hypothetical protein
MINEAIHFRYLFMDLTQVKIIREGDVTIDVQIRTITLGTKIMHVNP